MSPRHDNLRSLGRPPDLENVDLDAVVEPIGLGRDLLGGRKQRLDLAEVHEHVPLLAPLDGAGQHLAYPLAELFVDPLALGFADPLHNHLLGGLGSIRPKFSGVTSISITSPITTSGSCFRASSRLISTCAVLDRLHNVFLAEDVEPAFGTANAYANVPRRREVLLIRGFERGLYRRKQYLKRYFFLLFDLPQGIQEVCVHIWRCSPD